MALALLACHTQAGAQSEPFSASGASRVSPFLLRVIAGVDVLDLGAGRYAVHEFLDLHNDDWRFSVLVLRITADTWVGHKKDLQGENWMESEQPLEVPSASVVRIAERQRIVEGYPRPNWWVRWLRFKVQTDKGDFESDSISSPLRPPGRPVLITPGKKLDTLSSPGIPSPTIDEP